MNPLDKAQRDLRLANQMLTIARANLAESKRLDLGRQAIRDDKQFLDMWLGKHADARAALKKAQGK